MRGMLPVPLPACTLSVLCGTRKAPCREACQLQSPAGGGTGMRVSEESPVCCGFSQSSGQRHQAQPTCGAVRKQKAIGPSLTPGKFYGFKSTL